MFGFMDFDPLLACPLPCELMGRLRDAQVFFVLLAVQAFFEFPYYKNNYYT